MHVLLFDSISSDVFFVSEDLSTMQNYEKKQFAGNIYLTFFDTFRKKNIIMPVTKIIILILSIAHILLILSTVCQLLSVKSTLKITIIKTRKVSFSAKIVSVEAV